MCEICDIFKSGNKVPEHLVSKALAWIDKQLTVTQFAYTANDIEFVEEAHRQKYKHTLGLISDADFDHELAEKAPELTDEQEELVALAAIEFIYTTEVLNQDSNKRTMKVVFSRAKEVREKSFSFADYLNKYHAN